MVRSACAVLLAVMIPVFADRPAIAQDGQDATSTAAPAGSAVTVTDLLETMLDPARWAEWPKPAYRARSFAGLEEQGPGEERALLVMDGPGAITRIWTRASKSILRVYVDHNEAPLLEGRIADLSDSVGSPLADGRLCLLPIPFAKHCRITLEGYDAWRVDARSYAEGTAVESLTAAWLTEQAALLTSINERLASPHISFLYRSRLPRVIEPGTTTDLFHMASMGAIAEIRMRVAADDPERALRECLIICEFDGQETVRCPLGDFFGAAPGLRSYAGLPLAVEPDGTLVSRWFMPFREQGRIRLEHLGNEPIELSGTIGSTEHAWHSRSLHFHAEWRSQSFESTRPAPVYALTSIAGRGVWVGESLTVANPVAHWWGAGGTRIDADGTNVVRGVGADGDFGFPAEAVDIPSGALQGRVRRDGPGHFGHNSVHRFRALDAIPFERELAIHVDVEHAEDTDIGYASTGWFYGLDLRSDAPVITDTEPLAVRDMELPVWRRPGTIEAEELNIAETSQACIPLPEVQGDGTTGSWSGMTHYLCKAFAPGQSMTFDLPVEHTGRYEVILYLPTCADYGMVQCMIDGTPVGKPIDVWAEGETEKPYPPTAHSVGVVELTAPMAKLTLQNAGASPRGKGPGMEWALDCVELRRAE